jgi:heat shock protein HslJ
MSRRIAVPMMFVWLGIVLLVAAACAPIARPAPRVAVPAGQPAAEPAAAPSNDITDIVWLWTSLSNRATGETTTISDPQNYTITFRDDGTLSGKADCNTFTGTYSQEGGFFIQATPDVMAACGGDSRDIQYFELLDAIVAGGPDGAGGLALETAGGEQRMEFTNGGAAPAP